jgi:serine/threonine protein kinase
MMPDHGPIVEALSPPDRQVVEAYLVEFDQSWDPRRLRERVSQLPPPGDRLRRPLLLGIVQIDLRRRWREQQKVRVETYLKSLPELGTPETAPASLLLAEFEARRERGSSREELAKLAKRFPHQATELERLVGESAPDCASEAPPAQHARATTGSGAHDTSDPTRHDQFDPPREFGRYVIARLLGRGSMGAVYLAQDSQLHRSVALKIPRLRPEHGTEVVQRFLQEARATARLEHPNLCPVYDAGEFQGIPYMTMALIEGRSLTELARSRRLAPRQVAAICRKVALGMAHAHRRGVVHRDLKPANVLINHRGEPIVMDFGLARLFDQKDSRLTRVGTVVGSPAYMAPEHIRGDAQDPTSCDVYGLGVVLYEMLSGTIPFEGSGASVLARILTEQPPPPSAHRPGADSELEAICHKAMAKRVRDRYGSMSELAGALTAYLRRAIATARPPEDPPKAAAEPERPKVASREARETRTQSRRQTNMALPQPLAPAEDRKPGPHPPTRRWKRVATIAAAIVFLLLVGLLLGRMLSGAFFG